MNHLAKPHGSYDRMWYITNMSRGRRLSTVASNVVYRASDLNRRGREILDAAREGGARIADKDGVPLLLIPESEIKAAESASADLELAVCAHEILRDLEESRVVTLADFRWVNRLEADERSEFMAELRESLAPAGTHSDYFDLRTLLGEWEVTSRLPTGSLGVLEAPYSEDDWVSVERPA